MTIVNVPVVQEILLLGCALTARRMRTDVLFSRHNCAYLACAVYSVSGCYSHLLLDAPVKEDWMMEVEEEAKCSESVSRRTLQWNGGKLGIIMLRIFQENNTHPPQGEWEVSGFYKEIMLNRDLRGGNR